LIAARASRSLQNAGGTSAGSPVLPSTPYQVDDSDEELVVADVTRDDEHPSVTAFVIGRRPERNSGEDGPKDLCFDGANALAKRDRRGDAAFGDGHGPGCIDPADDVH
jgi:hypothetical protein